ncbi:Tat pathway signal protein [Rhodobacteraceae bacterium LMO-12]|nr:Tat pathway signal protein [Rhodobacteraceae bacterium LMO-JJ12]
MANLSRRGFIAAAVAAGTVRSLPQIAAKTGGGRRILTLVYDKAAGAMRAVERLVP